MHLLSFFSLSSECLHSVFIYSFASSLNFISYHCKLNEIQVVAQLQWYESELPHHPYLQIWKQDKMSLIIDLRNFARTNIQVILSKWNHSALGMLQKNQPNLGEKRKRRKKTPITKQTNKAKQTNKKIPPPKKRKKI